MKFKRNLIRQVFFLFFGLYLQQSIAQVSSDKDSLAFANELVKYHKEQLGEYLALINANIVMCEIGLIRRESQINHYKTAEVMSEFLRLYYPDSVVLADFLKAKSSFFYENYKESVFFSAEYLRKTKVVDPDMIYVNAASKMYLSDFRGAIDVIDRQIDVVSKNDSLNLSRLIYVKGVSLAQKNDSFLEGLLNFRESYAFDKDNQEAKYMLALSLVNLRRTEDELNEGCLLFSEMGEEGYDVYDVITKHCNKPE